MCHWEFIGALCRQTVVEGGGTWLADCVSVLEGKEISRENPGYHGLRVFNHLHSSLDESFLGPGGRQTMTRKGAMFLNSSWLTVALTIKQLPVVFYRSWVAIKTRYK